MALLSLFVFRCKSASVLSEILARDGKFQSMVGKKQRQSQSTLSFKFFPSEWVQPDRSRETRRQRQGTSSVILTSGAASPDRTCAGAGAAGRFVCLLPSCGTSINLNSKGVEPPESFHPLRSRRVLLPQSVPENTLTRKNISVVTVHISARGLLQLFHGFHPAIVCSFYLTIRFFILFLLSGLTYFYMNFTEQVINAPRFGAIING
jgi:hypothetical protein